MWESKAALTFLNLGFDVPPCLSGTEVRDTEICKSHVRSSLLHHLLFGPTLSGEEGRAGETERQEMICHPWFVIMLHHIPFPLPLFFFLSSFPDSRCVIQHVN